MMHAPMNLLTTAKARGTLTPVSTQTVLMRVSSRKTFADQARSGDFPARFSMVGRIGGLRPAGSARVLRSTNPVLPGHPFSSGRPGSFKGPLTMSDTASGDATPRAKFDPATEIGYYLSEDSHLDLQQLVSAIYAVGVLTSTPDGEVGADIEPHQLAPLFFTLARAGERIIEDLVDSFPAHPTPRRAPAGPTNDRRAA